MPSPSSGESGFDKLYQEHHEWLVRWISQRAPSSEHARDLAQDTFLRLLNRPAVPDVLHSPRAWLAKIAGNLAVDQLRRQRLEKNYLELLAALPEAEHPSPEFQLELLQILDQIDRLLDGLRPVEKTAFLMARLDGMAYKAIAAELDVSLSSVEKYIAKAMLCCYNATYGEA
ncbi:sigma-70 family RNA polymerase sigma factor [Bacterioplanoides sp. SCSIO 12839]|uniref:sigma-70 family RNA polymerase sigma factor n=1 Tax=Bacterioplanoides sp. SCSIO 12839 TaxID=2829569 RepID=UPI002102CD98|nr:sigma-70 family RNA polymerase sigma factor [Bacterioplanoides sp. SCSIO 12839]UTW48254.1 sigma-70 family RNA polymerase sigma factor [Bacterioplanoides sp. SCSIO 12839]